MFKSNYNVKGANHKTTEQNSMDYLGTLNVYLGIFLL